MNLFTRLFFVCMTLFPVIPLATASEPLKPEITSRKFDGIYFTQKRLSESETHYDAIIKQLAKQFGSGNAKNLPIDPQTAELTRLLQSIHGRCAYCVILHEQTARDMGIPQIKIDSLPAWRESQLFTVSEKAALNYTEVLSDLDQEHIQQAHDALKKHFDQAAVETLLMSIVNMDAYIKIFLAQGRQPAFSNK